jgi:crotonobetainyl-CoA:carnitine CoA-transferase CaiB-like acyl-CoA transferase
MGDERFANNAQRVRKSGELSAMLSDLFAEWERERLIEALDAAGVPLGDQHGRRRLGPSGQVARHVEAVPHPSGVDVPQVSTPMRFADAQLQTRRLPPCSASTAMPSCRNWATARRHCSVAD